MPLDPALTPILLVTAILSLIVTLAFGYLAAQEERIPGLRTVTAAYAFNTLRFVVVAYAAAIGLQWSSFLANICNAAVAVLLIGGSLRMVGRHPPKLVLGPLMALAIAGAAWGAWGGMPQMPRATLFIGLSAIGQFFFAWALLRLAAREHFASFRLAGALAAALGVLRLSSPFAIVEAAWQMPALVLANSLYLATAIALFIALQRSQFLEAREAHRRAERVQLQAQAAFDGTTDLMSLQRVEPGPRYVVEMVNPAFMTYTRAAYPGRPLGVFLGRDMEELLRADMGMDEAGIARILALYGEVVRTGIAQRSTVVHGMHVRASLYSPIKDAAGRVTHVFYRGTDMTDVQAARREAQSARERFEALFDLSPVPIVVGALEDGRYLAANEAFLALLGLERGDLDGHTSISRGVWDNAADRARVVASLKHGERVRAVPIRFRRKDGSAIETLYSAEIIDWMGERAVVATPQDVTGLKRAAAEIRRLNESLEGRVRERTAELEQALGELEAFSYSVSHDLRAPLRAMSSFASLLGRKPAVAADPQAAGYAERITRAAAHMGKVVDELLRYSRLSRQPVAMEAFALEAEVDAMVKDLAEQNVARRIRWKVGPLPTVRGDPTLLRLVLQNLLDNAVKYTRTREEATIEVSARESGGEVEVRVRDNGVGFDMAHAGKLFHPFQRLHHETEFEGTGIGMAHSRRIVERHAGRIGAEAAPGRGAAFWFTLPHAPARAAPDTAVR